MEGLMEILNATLSDAVTEAPRAECGGGAWCSKDLKDFWSAYDPTHFGDADNNSNGWAQ